MNGETLEDILSCPTLPSLPAVALRVIELTSKPEVSLTELAKTIQNDQGLAIKVLQTVNSSFYGLRTKCATIDRALVMLGLSPVKAIALGFSLVQCTNDPTAGDFDYPAYWRRGLYTAVGGKFLVEAAKKPYGDEVFLGGLLQDIGMVALYRALRHRYVKLLHATKGDHRKLVKAELDDLEIAHPDVGAMLAERWKLPSELVLPVKYHERPSAAPNEHNEIVHGVGLGNMIHDLLISPGNIDIRQRLYERARSWINLAPDLVDLTLDRVDHAAKEMADLFKVEMADPNTSSSLLARAEDQLLDMPAFVPTAMGEHELLLIDPEDVDPKTGIMGRHGFDHALRRAHAFANTESEPLALTNVLLEGAAALSPESTQIAITMLKKTFTPMGGAICRLGPNLFSVVMTGALPAAVSAAAESFSKSYASALQRLIPGATPGVCIGIAAVSAETVKTLTSPESLVHDAAKAIHSCRAAGGNCIRSAGHAAVAA